VSFLSRSSSRVSISFSSGESVRRWPTTKEATKPLSAPDKPTPENIKAIATTLNELSNLGSALSFRIHSPKFLEVLRDPTELREFQRRLLRNEHNPEEIGARVMPRSSEKFDEFIPEELLRVLILRRGFVRREFLEPYFVVVLKPSSSSFMKTLAAAWGAQVFRSELGTERLPARHED
jgi:hypothetical protein